MSLFLVRYTYVADAAALDEHRPAHRAFLAELPGLLLSGPSDDGGAFLLFEAAGAGAVETLLDDDPFRTRALIAERRVTGWNVVLGSARQHVLPPGSPA